MLQIYGKIFKTGVLTEKVPKLFPWTVDKAAIEQIGTVR